VAPDRARPRDLGRLLVPGKESMIPTVAMEDHTPIRRFRLPDADIVAYIRWRIARPDAKLSGLSMIPTEAVKKEVSNASSP